MDISKKQDYFQKVGVSNSLLNVVDKYISGESRNKKFREHSYSSFLGSAVHALVAGECAMTDFISIKAPPLSGMQVDVWYRVTQGWDLEQSIRESYTRDSDVKKQLEALSAIYADYNTFTLEHDDKTVVSLQRLLWKNNKLTDEEIIQNINTAYALVSQYLSNDKCLLGVFEEEIYWTHETGIRCKSKPDYWFYNRDGTISLKDFKIGSGNIYDKMRDRNYCRQLAFYGLALETTYNTSVKDYSIVYCDTANHRVQEIDISPNDIKKALNGGYHTIRTDNQYPEASNLYCTPERLTQLKASSAWTTPNQEYKVLGVLEILSWLQKNSCAFNIEFSYPF